MGKRSRREGRRSRKQGVRWSDRLRVTVVTHPESSQGGISLKHDVELVRASVLYADEVTVVSPGAAMLGSALQLASCDEAGLLEFIGSLPDETLGQLGADLPDGWRQLLPLMMNLEVLNQVGLGRESEELADGLRKAMDELRTTTATMLGESGGEELVAAFQSGVVTLSPSGLDDATSVEDMVAGWLRLLEGLLADASSRLVFDQRMADLVRTMMSCGHARPHPMTLQRAGEAAVGTGLIARLPSFPSAPLDELLDLRRDLEAPLARFRRGVVRISRRMRASALTPTVSAEIDDVWTTDVAPTLLELDDGFATHGLVREVARQAAIDVRRLILEGSGIFLLLGSVSSVDEALRTASAAAAPLLDAASRGILSSREGRKELQQHDLFYLYEVNRRLAT